jgi:hypothetical protein
MSKHSAARPADWGFAAVATTLIVAALAAGAGIGTWLALAGLTEDPAVATRTILQAAVVVAIAADLVFMARVVRSLLRTRRQR